MNYESRFISWNLLTVAWVLLPLKPVCGAKAPRLTEREQIILPKEPKTIKISKLFPLHFSILQASKLDFGFISYFPTHSPISIQFILIFLEVILSISIDYFKISMGPSTPSLPAVVKRRRIPMALNYSLG